MQIARCKHVVKISTKKIKQLIIKERRIYDASNSTTYH